MNTLPRIRGRVGTIESDDPEFNGKFAFEIFLTFMGAGEGRKLGDWGPFDTEDEAKRALRKQCQEICEVIQKEFVGETSSKYLDMKTNEIRDWQEQ